MFSLMSVSMEEKNLKSYLIAILNVILQASATYLQEMLSTPVQDDLGYF